MFFKDCIHIISLILPDIRYEWILSLCMVLALGAIFSPLFILLGLQEGIVGNMLDKLQRDPVNLLVTPRFPTKKPLDTSWLKALGERATLVISSPTSRLLLDIEGSHQRFNTLPTSPQDPLLRENGIRFPEQINSLVISERLSKDLGKHIGDVVKLVLVRHIGETERITQPFNLVGILPETVTPEPKLWLHKKMFHDIYQWRRGKALSSLNLPGKGGYLAPDFNGIATMLEKLPSSEDYRRMLAGKLSFGKAPEPFSKPSWIIPQGKQVRVWKPTNSQIFLSDIPPLVNRHYESGYPVEAVPFIVDFTVELTSATRNKQLTLTILPTSLQPGITLENGSPFHVYVSPDEFQYSDGLAVSISFVSGSSAKKKITLPVVLKTSPHVALGYISFPAELAGKMNAARRQLVSYDPVKQEFIPESSSRHYFRAYAKSINDIETLVEFTREQGHLQGENALREPVSKLEQVRHLRKLSGYLQKLYLLIVLVAGVSGFFAIAASVYAGVERKRRDLAYLQLLGVHRWVLFLFPYLKSQALVLGGLVIAYITYLIFGYFADMMFGDVLQGAGSLTRLSLSQSLILVAVIFVAASLASLIAAATVNRIEVGEIIHG